jgi:hypothetical protein
MPGWLSSRSLTVIGTVKTLSRPSYDAVTLFDSIVASKDEPRRSILRSLSTAVYAAYHAYEKAVPEVQSLVPPSPSNDEHEALLHCYKSRTKPFKRVYQEIFQSTYSCPYCEIVKVQTLDHFLEKEIYPDLAILPVNLVPACFDCNRPRPRGIAPNGARSLMHPYFDASPVGQILHATIERAGVHWRAAFRMEDGASGEPDVPDLYQRHHRLLKLLPRYRAWAEEEGIPSIRLTVATWGREVGPESATVTLQRYAADLRRKHGANHPSTVIHQAAAEHDDFVRLTIDEGP